MHKQLATLLKPNALIRASSLNLSHLYCVQNLIVYKFKKNVVARSFWPDIIYIIQFYTCTNIIQIIPNTLRELFFGHLPCVWRSVCAALIGSLSLPSATCRHHASFFPPRSEEKTRNTKKPILNRVYNITGIAECIVGNTPTLFYVSEEMLLKVMKINYYFTRDICNSFQKRNFLTHSPSTLSIIDYSNHTASSDK